MEPVVSLQMGLRMAGTEDIPSKIPDRSVVPSLPAGGWWARAFDERSIAAVGVLAFLAGTLPGLWPGVYRTLTVVCLVVAGLFLIQYILRLRRQANPLEWTVTGPAIVDLLAVLPIPLALLFGADGEVARLFGVLWSLKLIRMNAAFALLGRVLHNERQSLMSVTTAFFVVVLFAATTAFVLERKEQPEAFGSVPAALWWAVTTITTTGYGDKIPATFAGRTLAGLVMVAGIGLFALWAGILASGFAHELRRREFLQSWDVVVRLPLFRNLGAPALAEVARLLKVQTCHRGSTVVRQGQPGDSMFFIAEGEVEVQAGAARIRLRAGQFFGEMALISGAPRNATVVAATPARLLRLDVVDFRELAARQPELLQVIEAENARRSAPPMA
jgi:voltage-gated potassium channel